MLKNSSFRGGTQLAHWPSRKESPMKLIKASKESIIISHNF
jgi:hypothetical protein